MRKGVFFLGGGGWCFFFLLFFFVWKKAPKGYFLAVLEFFILFWFPQRLVFKILLLFLFCFSLLSFAHQPLCRKPYFLISSVLPFPLLMSACQLAFIFGCLCFCSFLILFSCFVFQFLCFMLAFFGMCFCYCFVLCCFLFWFQIVKHIVSLQF